MFSSGGKNSSLFHSFSLVLLFLFAVCFYKLRFSTEYEETVGLTLCQRNVVLHFVIPQSPLVRSK